MNQEERVRGLGAYVRGELAVTSSVSMTGTVRSDQTRFEVTDRRQTDPALAEPPPRTLSAVSPMFGINWRLGSLTSAYASISTSFETPTTTELANSPTGVGGLNADLKPQRGVSYEVGVKGTHSSGIRYDAALFTIQTEDELIPFQVPGAGAGRVYYENAGQTTRKGFEAGLSGRAGPVSLGAAATWLQYVYDDFVLSGTSFNGNRVPGVAPMTVNAFASVQPRWGLAALELMHAGQTGGEQRQHRLGRCLRHRERARCTPSVDVFRDGAGDRHRKHLRQDLDFERDRQRHRRPVLRTRAWTDVLRWLEDGKPREMNQVPG